MHCVEHPTQWPPCSQKINQSLMSFISNLAISWACPNTDLIYECFRSFSDQLLLGSCALLEADLGILFYLVSSVEFK